MSSPVVAPYSPGPGSPLAVFSSSTVSGSFPQMHELYPPSPSTSMPEHTQHHSHPHQQNQHQQNQLQLHPYQHHVHPPLQSHSPHYSHHRQVRPTISSQQLRSLQQLQIEQAMYERQFNIEQELQEQQRQAQRQEQQRQEQQRQDQQPQDQQRQQNQFLQHPLHIQLSSQSDKTKPSRRWSLTGRFFEKRKSALESTTSLSTSFPPQASPSPLTSNICSTGRRPSLADLPKAFLSSLRRTSLTGPDAHAPPSSKEPSVTPLPMTEPVGKVISMTTEEKDDDEEFGTATILTSTGLCQATLATPKAPPKTNSPPKSILKKRSLDIAASMGLPLSSSSPQVSKLEPVKDVPSSDTRPIDLDATSDHPTRVDTQSPAPRSSSPMTPSWSVGALPPVGFTGAPPEAFEFGIWPPMPKAVANSSSPLPSLLTKSNLSLSEQLSPSSSPQRAMSHGAAFPPDFTPGVQSNSYQDRGGERPQGATLGDPNEAFPPQQYFYEGEFEPQQQGVPYRYPYSLEGPFSASEAMAMSDQDELGHDYGQVENGPTNGMGSSGVLSGNGVNRRCINFLDTIEIIPAHRKSDYNRRSDKNATFKILTADMKCEIREELNSYKMREMAVHIESMGNTAFH
ncbi:MAG: hypothetical protein BYD32DRAFT_459807 [Podila humilis]|nr:MAG: hypothetical protein BYD32DRAFT_459807 [Podila humilis]